MRAKVAPSEGIPEISEVKTYLEVLLKEPGEWPEDELFDSTLPLRVS